MINVAVIAGGTSAEREVSLRSGTAVQAALTESGKYNVTFLDPINGFESISSEVSKADVVFPALHGKFGEDGTLQKLLEDLGVAYVGCDSVSSKLCFDKAAYGDLMTSNGILMPFTEIVTWDNVNDSSLISKPYVLKPNGGGSSIDTFIVRDPQDFDLAKTEQAFKNNDKMLIQQLVVGIEITVAVLFNDALPVIEIIPPADQEFDYVNKYNGATQEICPAEHLSQEVQELAGKLAVKIHGLTNCRDLSRTDMIVAGDDSLYVLETNTLPGLTKQSLYPKAAQVGGLGMAELTDKLVESALSRRSQ